VGGVLSTVKVVETELGITESSVAVTVLSPALVPFGTSKLAENVPRAPTKTVGGVVVNEFPSNAMETEDRGVKKDPSTVTAVPTGPLAGDRSMRGPGSAEATAITDAKRQDTRLVNPIMIGIGAFILPPLHIRVSMNQFS
jgi:hypothetical protein